MITDNQEDYLRTIYRLQEQGEEVARVKGTAEAENEGVRSTDLAARLKVSKPSVSRMIETLAKRKLVVAKRYGRIALTSQGERLAREMTVRHRLIECFLVQKLHVPESKVHEIAHRMEHALDAQTTELLRAYLGNPRVDPHGKAIPPVKTTRGESI